MSDSNRTLNDLARERGGVAGFVDGVSVVRHYGDPEAEYRAAVEGAAIFDRSHRGRLRVHGRAPVQMLQGILTNSVPPAPVPEGEGLFRGRSAYSTLLTPKGRMVTDLTLCWCGADEETGLFLDLPRAGVEGATSHFGKFMPPRFATVTDISDSVGMVTVVGPESGATLEGVVADAEPGGFVLAGGGPLDGGYLAMAGPEGLSVIAAPDMLAELWTALEARGAVPAGWGVWDTLRVEAGRPAFGRDMDDRTIPIEAGLEDAIDHSKGCYTGQEVIVRIRDRGHVNWHLRRLELGESTPNPGDELFEEGGEKALGRVTSSVQSPGFGQVVGLGYVRREVDTPAQLHLGAGDGPPVRVTLLED